MKPRIPNIWFFGRLALCMIALEACHRKKAEVVVDLPGLPPVEDTEDKITREIWQFRLKTRSLYNASKFDELEALATQLRAERTRFGNGSWKIDEFYESLGCRSDEPETMWQLHESIHEHWEAAKPRSITAQVAHANFLTEYAWHARGSGFAKTVTKEGWRLLSERLAKAKELLDKSADLEPKCPMWWLAYLSVAQGQGWSRDDFETLFEAAKTFEPEFWWYDITKGYYLLPRWYGHDGDWEYALSLEVDRRKGVGLEAYARVVDKLKAYYKNIFRESRASWAATRDGFELMRQRYPVSLEILSDYCRVACVAEDRAVARKLFDELSGRVLKSTWRDQNNFRRWRNWAYNQ